MNVKARRRTARSRAQGLARHGSVHRDSAASRRGPGAQHQLRRGGSLNHVDAGHWWWSRAGEAAWMEVKRKGAERVGGRGEDPVWGELGREASSWKC